MYRLSADILVIGRYIGLADKANAYRYRLLVSADKNPYIGSLNNMLNHTWGLKDDGWILRLGVPKLSNLFGKNIFEQNLIVKL